MAGNNRAFKFCSYVLTTLSILVYIITYYMDDLLPHIDLFKDFYKEAIILYIISVCIAFINMKHSELIRDKVIFIINIVILYIYSMTALGVTTIALLLNPD